MLKILEFGVTGVEHAIRGMRNPLNSWDKMDSYDSVEERAIFHVGFNDLQLMKKLAKAGSEHAKYRRMIAVYADILAPLYWWKEFDTYKVGTVANSCSTMHTIAEKEFTLSDFSCEHLIGHLDVDERYFENDEADEDLSEPDVVKLEAGIYPFHQVGGCMPAYALDWLKETCKILNAAREKYIETKDKKYWWQMIQLLPSSYNQRRTVMMNYEVLHNIYNQRKNHKLDEWHTLCDWIETLPLADGIIF